MARFARVTEIETGKVHWINLDHVRQIIEQKPLKDVPVHTSIHLDSSWSEQRLDVTQTPEEILAQSAFADAGRI
jgi:hypothetical protein